MRIRFGPFSEIQKLKKVAFQASSCEEDTYSYTKQLKNGNQAAGRKIN